MGPIHPAWNPSLLLIYWSLHLECFSWGWFKASVNATYSICIWESTLFSILVISSYCKCDFSSYCHCDNNHGGDGCSRVILPLESKHMWSPTSYKLQIEPSTRISWGGALSVADTKPHGYTKGVLTVLKGYKIYIKYGYCRF